MSNACQTLLQFLEHFPTMSEATVTKSDLNCLRLNLYNNQFI